MTPIAKDELHPILLDILKAFQQYCSAHSLKYFISDGTLLGAVRHGGFIPWDDDIDVAMMASEYDKLEQFSAGDPYLDEEHRYMFLAPATHPNFFPFFRVVDTYTLTYQKDMDRRYSTGIWMDIFRYTPFNPNAVDVKQQYAKGQRLKQQNKINVCGNFSTKEYNLLLPILVVIKAANRLLGMNADAIGKKMLDLQNSNRYEGPEATKIFNFTWAERHEDVLEREWFEETVLLDFCDTKQPAPAKYDEVLTRLFGDYMQLPPVEQRIAHDFEAYWK